MLFHNKQQLINNGKTETLKQKRKDVLTILETVIEAVDPLKAVNRCFQQQDLIFEKKKYDLSDYDHLYLVGFGKASIGMAKAVCDNVTIDHGAVITNDNNTTVENSNIKTFHGGHPLPNQGSIDGARYIKTIASSCQQDDLLIVLISGGGSALLCYPKISLSEMQTTTQLLLESGANIKEINTIRKHLSYVKGGQLIGDTTCQVLSMIISDVINNPIEFIASGPTAPDSTTYQDVKDIFENYSLWNRIPQTVQNIIKDGLTGLNPETLKQDNPVFSRVHHELIATNELACKQAMITAERLGYNPRLLTTSLSGEAREMGTWLLDQKTRENNDLTVIITGGETTVTIKGDGKGGRNQELILGAVPKLHNTESVLASFATDGIDGASNAAGAIADAESYNRSKAFNLDIETYLAQNDSYAFFDRMQDLLLTGPTGTNVMDVQILIS